MNYSPIPINRDGVFILKKYSTIHIFDKMLCFRLKLPQYDD